MSIRRAAYRIVIRATAVLVSAHPAAAQQDRDPITVHWGAASAAVLADSTLGLLVAAVQPGSRLVRFTGRFAPGPAASWARQADTLIGHLPAPGSQFLPLLAEDGSVLALGADSASGPDLVFRPARSPAYSLGVSLEDLRRFLAAVVTAALASDMSPETPPTSHDSLGTIYWSLGEDSVLVGPRPIGQATPRVPAGLQYPGTKAVAWLRYVVDNQGRVEPATITVLWASHRDWGVAVSATIRHTKFRPGRLGNTSVRTGVIQLVTLDAR